MHGTFGPMEACSSPGETLAGPWVPRISMTRRASLLVRRVIMVEWEFGAPWVKTTGGGRVFQTRRAHDPTIRSSQESRGTRLFRVGWFIFCFGMVIALRVSPDGNQVDGLPPASSSVLLESITGEGRIGSAPKNN